MATIVEYNGITLYNVMTRKWDEDIIYDQSGTDEIGKKYSFVFQGILHQQRIPLTDAEVFISTGDTSVDTNLAGGNVFTLLETVKRILNHPRATLKISFGTLAVNTVALLIVPATTTPVEYPSNLPTNADIDNGPKPRVISVVPIGSKAFRITFGIDAVTGTCANNERTSENMVLSNRWSLTETMDQDYYVTRRINGQLRLAAGVFAVGTDGPFAQIRGFPGHAYKNLTIPPLENGFKRDMIGFTCAPDGLTCTYEVVDRQVHDAAPWPATRWRVMHRENSQNGTYFTSEASVQLWGDASCDKRLLVERAIQILNARLGLTALPDEGKNAYVDSFTIADYVDDAAMIDAYARVNRTDQISQIGFLNPFWGKLGKRINLPPLTVRGSEVENTEYDPLESRVPGIYGYKASDPTPDHERRPIVLFFLHCYLQNPCSNIHDVGPGEPIADEHDSDTGTTRETAAEVFEVEEGTLAYSPDSETFSDATKAAIYTTAEVSTKYRTMGMTVGLPIANLNLPPESNPSTAQGQQDLLLRSIYGEPKYATTRVLPLALPQTYRVHSMNLERIGSQPAIPQPVAAYQHGTDVVAHFKDFDVEILTPIRSPDGSQQVHRVVARYVYLLDRMPNYGEPIQVGVNPITKFSDYTGSLSLDFTGDMGLGTQTTSNGPQTG